MSNLFNDEIYMTSFNYNEKPSHWERGWAVLLLIFKAFVFEFSFGIFRIERGKNIRERGKKKAMEDVFIVVPYE